MEKENVISRIQAELKAPKSQHNNFGNYNYRNCEDILEAVKPILFREGLDIVIKDEVVLVGNRYYVKATCTLSNGYFSVAYAREAESKKGMDEAQITGAASSYARKYALNGLFAIDDTKDADSQLDDRATIREAIKPVVKELKPEGLPPLKRLEPIPNGVFAVLCSQIQNKNYKNMKAVKDSWLLDDKQKRILNDTYKKSKEIIADTTAVGTTAVNIS